MYKTLALIAAASLYGQADTLRSAVISDSRNIAATSSAPLQRVYAEQLQSTGAISLAEALRTFSGISVKDYGGIGGLKTVSIRNFGAQHTGVVYDGIALSDARGGQIDIGRFNLENVQSISVQTGGSDDIFQSAHLSSSAGVLTITSRRPDFTDSNTHVSARMRYGSFATYNPYISIEQRLGREWSAVLTADYMNSRGDYPFVLHNGAQTTVEKRLNSQVQSLGTELNVYSSDLAIKIAFSGASRGLPGGVILYYQHPTEHLWSRNITASALYKKTWSPQWKMKASLAYSNAWDRYTNSDPAYPIPLDDRYDQHEITASATALYSPITGFDLSLAQDLSVAHLRANLNGFAYPVRLASYTSLSARYAIRRFKITGGLLLTGWGDRCRAANAGADGSTRLNGTSEEKGKSGARIHLSPWLSASYRLPEKTGLMLRASLKDGYRMPTFNDMYYPRLGTVDLRPEKALQSNLGIVWNKSFGGEKSHQALHHIGISADAYYNMVSDKIVARPTLFIWSMRNVGRVQMTGCDLAASYDHDFASWIALKAEARYSYQYAVDITDKSAANYRHQIPYSPRHCGSASATISTPWVNLGYTLSAAGKRYSLAQNLPQYRIEPYMDHSLSINGNVPLGRKHRWLLHWSAEALNLAGVNYEIIQYYPMPGRNYRISIKITY